MEYNKETTKYCLLSFAKWQQEFSEQFTKHTPAISGLFQWCNVLGGKMDFPRTPEQFDQYNLVHINITPTNLMMLAKVLPKINRNKTKVLLNVDYSIDLWTNNFVFPELFLQEIDKADYIFAVEEKMAELLTIQLKRNVPCIPHPTDVEGIGKLATLERDSTIGIHVHRYDKNYLLPWFALNSGTIDISKYATCLLGGSCEESQVSHLYDSCLKHLSFPEMMQVTSRMLLAIETYTIRSYGRYSIECAALAVPCIGSNYVSSINRCFPELAIETNDIRKMADLTKEILYDSFFYQEVTNKAQEEVTYYNFENSRIRMFNFLNSKQ